MILIGLDAASDRKKFGYAIGLASGESASIIESGCLSGGPGDGIDVIAEAIVRSDQRVLLAIDAPLGWPDGLREGLFDHQAGKAMAVDKDRTFRRRTELILRDAPYKIQPLEVAADRIARAAHEALTVLNEIRVRTRIELPLVWHREFRGAGAIEVYPAATLRAHGVASKGYKLPEQIDVRRDIANQLETRLSGLTARCSASPDEFDACLCLLAALDFVNGACLHPSEENQQIALREGWIWVRRSWKAIGTKRPKSC